MNDSKRLLDDRIFRKLTRKANYVNWDDRIG